MSALTVTCNRTVSQLRHRVTTAIVAAVFLAVTAVLFVLSLADAEGSRLSLASVWALAVSYTLPALVAFLAMDVWSDERRTGRIDALLSVAVRERDFVLGKALGVLAAAGGLVLVSLVTTVVPARWFAPSLFGGSWLVAFLPALIALLLQGMMWTSLTVMISAMFSRPAASLAVSLLITTILPRGLWMALMRFSAQGRPAYGEMPLDAQVVDFASGVFALGDVVIYPAIAVTTLFIASKMVASLRFAGRGGFVGRLSCGFVSLLAVVFAALVTMLAWRFDMTLDLPIGGGSVISPRTSRILSETSGEIWVTCFLPRQHAGFRTAAQLLRVLKRESEIRGGATFRLRFVDPRWDIGEAAVLIRQGFNENMMIFAKRGRTFGLPIDEKVSERSVVNAIRRVAMPLRRREVCWTVGHGECRFDAYERSGMSDIARELQLIGYENRVFDFSIDKSVSRDCAMMIVAGATKRFSRDELMMIDAYLRDGGRLLVLMDGAAENGLTSLLSTWGVKVVSRPNVAVRTLSGTDMIVGTFANHPITEGLVGTNLVLEKPLAFERSVAHANVNGVDNLEYTALAIEDNVTYAVAIERGSGIGDDLALRPTRIVVIGDASLVMNGELTARGNANQDFFMNSVAYLSGSDPTAGGVVDSLLTSGMSRDERRHLAYTIVVIIPLLVLLTMLVSPLRRRYRL